MSAADSRSDADAAGLRVTLVGAGVAERAVAWSAVGFLISLYLTPVVADTRPDLLAPLGLGIALLPTLGAVALAARGRGVLPAVALPFGPLAGYFLRTVDPALLSVPYVEALGVALAGAAALGLAAYVAGRAAAILEHAT
ncbi:hypothetical protein [Haloparvum sedimenti]|uniref:hypothetical protein n=1 Tax=Haloparvum sedimenti TaxID=1678448 RepID=UPI00071E7DB7|nr:hypothetical protein [Haloparvum sedimenti]